LRCLFAIFCAYCEKRLYAAVSSNINRRVGILYLIVTLCSAGMFHAAAAFLPSTFAMYTTMLGMAAFINRQRGLRTVQAIFWFALGGLLGWPFSMAMCIPFILEELFMGVISWGLVPTVFRFIKGGIASLFLLVSRNFCAFPFLEKPAITVI
jgi:alpha-1,2-mannosyltransferase